MAFKLDLGSMSIFKLIFLLMNLILLARSAVAEPGLAMVSRNHEDFAIFNKLNMTMNWFARNDTGAAIIKNAAVILQRLDQGSSCGMEAALLLAEACRTAQDGSPTRNQPDMIFESLKNLYSVRAAICENIKGGAKVPSACQSTVSMRKSGIDLSQQVQLDLELSISAPISKCVRALRKEGPYWTSYSNSQQDASSMCGAFSADVDILRATESYREILQNLSGFVQLISSQRDMSEAWLRENEQRAHELNKAHLENMILLNHQYEAQSNNLSASFLALSDNTHHIDAVMSQISAQTSLALNQASLMVNVLDNSLHAAQLQFDHFFTQGTQNVAVAMQKHQDAITSLNHAFYNMTGVAHGLVSQLDTALVQSQELTFAQRNNLELAKIERDMLQDSISLSATVVDHLEGMSKAIQVFESWFQLWNVYAWDLVLFTFVLSASLLLLLIAGARIWASYIMLSYVLIQCGRKLLRMMNINRIYHQITEPVGHFVASNPGYLACFGSCVLLLLVAGYLRARAVWLRQIAIKRDAYQAFERGLVARGRYTGARRAFYGIGPASTPPGL